MNSSEGRIRVTLNTGSHLYGPQIPWPWIDGSRHIPRATPVVSSRSRQPLIGCLNTLSSTTSSDIWETTVMTWTKKSLLGAKTCGAQTVAEEVENWISTLGQ